MIRRPPRSTRTDTLFPYTTLFRSTTFPVGSIWMKSASSIDPSSLASQPVGLPALSENIFLTTYAKRERSEEHTSELQSLMRISYAVFCLKKKNNKIYNNRVMTITSEHKIHENQNNKYLHKPN